MGTRRVDRKLELIEELEARFGLTEEQGDRPFLTFRQFVDKVFPRYKWYYHCQVLSDILQLVADDELRRLMVFMPPRLGKSQLVSKLFPAYYLYRHPERFVGLNSYAAELAYTFSRASRDAYREVGGQLREDASAVKNWETPQGGGCWAAGVGGPITGKGFSLGVIDDPLKNSEEAFSDKIRAKQKEWYGSTFYTRAEPEGAIVVVQTRWHEDDLAGWLLHQETADDEPECWHIVNFEAIKQAESPQFPETCSVEPDWRKPGESLCPERFPEQKFRRIEKRVGSYFWNALYMQRPMSLDGDLFKRDWWQYYSVVPGRMDSIVISVDSTFKDKSDSDFVVVQVWGVVGASYYLLDQVRDRLGIVATENAIRQLEAKWKPDATLVEDRANGPAIVERLSREIPGVIAVNPEGGKVARATAVSPLVEAGNVFLPENQPWIADFIAEFATFPSGTHDDQVDAFSQALIWLARRPVGEVEFASTGSRISYGMKW